MKKDELKDMYIEFLANFYLLIKYLGYKHPIDIYTLFLYMLDHGYLSYKKDFKRIECKIENHDYLPLTIVSGKGVCRNISTMLSDIYHVQQLDNLLTLVYMNPPEINVLNKLGDPREIKEKEEMIKRYSYLPKRREELLKKLHEYGDKAFMELTNLNEHGGTFIYYLGNHIVNTVEYNNQVYILDPTNYYSLKQSNVNKYYLLDRFNNPYHITTPFHKPEEVDNLFEKLKKVKTTIEEDEERIEGIKIDLESKKELLESFYDTNKKIYKDISIGLTQEKILKKIKKDKN